MGIENPPIVPTEAEDKVVLAEKDLSPESPEKKEIFEKAQTGRASLASKIFSRRTADVIGNLTPGIDVAKFTTEAIRGKTVAGKELSGRERINYALIGGSVALTYALYFSGKPHEAMKAKEFAMGISAIQFSPEFFKNAIQKAREKFPQATDLAEKSFNYFKDGKLLEDINQQIQEYLKTPGVMSPDLNAE